MVSCAPPIGSSPVCVLFFMRRARVLRSAIGLMLSTAGNCTIIDGQTGTSAPALKITNPIREDAVEKLYIRL